MAGVATGRLKMERKEWRKNHPVGFVARPRRTADGSTDLMNWDVTIPAKADSKDWKDCEFKLTMQFSNDYPSEAPIVKFTPVLWHLNVWSSGRICLNLLNADDGTWHGKWRASTTIKEILVAVQTLLDEPNPSGARPDVEKLYRHNKPAYQKRLKEEAAKYKKSTA